VAHPSFYNDNESRSYPFAPAADGSHAYPLVSSSGATKLLPNSLVVDFSAIVGFVAQWSAGSSIFLKQVEALSGVDAGRFALHFYADAPGLAWLELAFVVGPSPREFTTYDAAATLKGSYAAPPPICSDTLRWEGTLVLGRLDDLLALTTPGEVLTAADGAIRVEPALVQDVASSYVRAIGVANAPRLMAAPGPDCAPPAPADDLLVVNRRCLVGDVVFAEGYNCAISQASRDNSLAFAAAAGAGAGRACSEVPLYDGEAPPEGSSLLAGGPTCNEVVTSVNGLSAGLLQLIGGPGVTVAADGPHKLVVAVDYNELKAGCAGGET
jgi:hypothetical protein